MLPEVDHSPRFDAAQREASRQRHETEAQAEKRNAITEWLELLASQDDAAWKEQLIGMGSAQNVPKLFHHNGKVRTRFFRSLKHSFEQDVC